MISLTFELSDGKGRRAHGWLFFDADCQFCTRFARWLSVPLQRRGFAVAALQDPRVASLLGLNSHESPLELRFLDRDAHNHSGGDAVIALARELWWARPFVAAASLPGMKVVIRRGYQMVAVRRKCSATQCATLGLS